LIFELLGDVTRTRARNFNPSLGEESTGRKHEKDVDNSVNGIQERFFHGVRG